MSRFSDYALFLGPASYWRLGEPAGNLAIDERFVAHGAYPGGNSLGLPGLVGDLDTAANTHGSHIAINAAVHAALFSGVHPFSIALWTKHTPIASYQEPFVVWDPGFTRRVIIASHSTELLIGRDADLFHLPPLDSAPHFVALVYDGEGLWAYVDDVRTDGISTTSLPTMNGFAGFGAVEGTTDEVLVFGRALSFGEVADLYAAGSPPVSSTQLGQMIDPTGMLIVRIRDYVDAVAAAEPTTRRGKAAIALNDAIYGDRKAANRVAPYVILRRLGPSRRQGRSPIARFRYSADAFGRDESEATDLYGLVSDALHGFGPSRRSPGVALYGVTEELGAQATIDPDTGEPRETAIFFVSVPLAQA
jgi:hypothetical protein